MKKCVRCQQFLSRDSFNRCARAADGLQSWCRECTCEYTKRWSKENPTRRRASARANYAADPERHITYSRRHAIKRKYGLTLEEYEAIIAKGCAICGVHRSPGPGGMALDHDHANGKIRDALCQNCNFGLGSFGDDPARLKAAAKYLETHRLKQ